MNLEDITVGVGLGGGDPPAVSFRDTRATIPCAGIREVRVASPARRVAMGAQA